MAATPDTPNQNLPVMFAVVTTVALGLLSLSWHESLLDRYEFRQLQTALSAFWIAREGWQLNYLLPLFGPPWSVPMEFPIYQVIVATLHSLTGLPLEQAGRLTGISFLLLTLPAVYDLLAVAGLRRSRRLIVLALILSGPVYLFYARTFMIETTALCFAVWFLALFRRALAHTHPGWVIAATLAATLAALTKITTFLVFGIPALALAMAALRTPRPASGVRTAFFARIGISVLIAAVSLGLTWWWISHGDAVKDANPFTGFLTARELQAWNYGPWSLRGDWSYWLKMQENIVSYNLSEGALALAMLCVPFATRRIRWIAGIAVLGFFSGPLVFANLYHIHDYYYAANSILLLAAAGLLLAAAWDDPRLPRGTNWLVLILMLAFQWHAFYRGYYSHHRNPAPPPPALATIIRDTVPADGVVLIYGADWNPLLPYYFQRRAVMVPGERENETDVLEQVLQRLPPRRISAMVVHGERLLSRPDFLQERARYLGLSPRPFHRSGLDELYLPETAGSDTVVPLPAADDAPSLPGDNLFSASLQRADLTTLDLAIFQPAPAAIYSRYGVQSAAHAGRRVLETHAPVELIFEPPPGARAIHAIVGLHDSAFAPGADAVTDGITVEIFAAGPHGLGSLLYHRTLDPAGNAADRGPQIIQFALPQSFGGSLHFRLGNGAKNDPTRDWAYWLSVNIR